MRLFNFLKKKKEEAEKAGATTTPVVASAVPASEKRAHEKKRGPRAQVVPGVLLRALVTEKGTHLEAQGTYQFAVARTATKIDIARAFESRYGVRPISVNVMNRHGKAVRFGRMFGRRSDWRRALVTVPKGTTINVHEGV